MRALSSCLFLLVGLSACTASSSVDDTGDDSSGDDSSGDDSGQAGDDTSTDGGDDTAGEAMVHELDVQTLVEWLAEEGAGERELLLINTHIPYAGEIPGTDANIAYTDGTELVAEIGADLDRLTVVYCRSGSMSASAADLLVAEGYRDVYDLDGGMNAWTAAGYTLDE